MEEVPLPLTTSLWGGLWKQLKCFFCWVCEISSCTCHTAQPSQADWYTIALPYQTSVHPTDPGGPLCSSQRPASEKQWGGGLRGQACPAAPPLFLVWLCCPCPGCALQCCLLPRAPQVSARDTAMPATRPSPPGPAMGSLPWGSPIFNTWRYGHTAPLPLRALRWDPGAGGPASEVCKRTRGILWDLREKWDDGDKTESLLSTGETWGPASPLPVSEEQVPPFSKHSWSQQGYSPGTEELRLTWMCWCQTWHTRLRPPAHSATHASPQVSGASRSRHASVIHPKQLCAGGVRFFWSFSWVHSKIFCGHVCFQVTMQRERGRDGEVLLVCFVSMTRDFS